MMRTQRQAHTQAEGWLRRAVRAAPHPLPTGRFGQLLRQGEAAGFDRDMLLNVLDEWLNYGYCRLTDPLAPDIEILPAGKAALVAGPPEEEG